MNYKIEFSEDAQTVIKKWKKSHDRIIYDIYDEVVTVLVLELEGHYNDK